MSVIISMLMSKSQSGSLFTYMVAGLVTWTLGVEIGGEQVTCTLLYACLPWYCHWRRRCFHLWAASRGLHSSHTENGNIWRGNACIFFVTIVFGHLPPSSYRAMSFHVSVHPISLFLSDSFLLVSTYPPKSKGKARVFVIYIFEEFLQSRRAISFHV